MSYKIELQADTLKQLKIQVIATAKDIGIVIAGDCAPAVAPAPAPAPKTKGKRRGRPKAAAVKTSVHSSELDDEGELIEQPAQGDMFDDMGADDALEEPAVTQEDLFAVMKELTSTDPGMAHARALLQKAGYKKVRDIKEKDYASLLAAGQAFLNG